MYVQQLLFDVMDIVYISPFPVLIK